MSDHLLRLAKGTLRLAGAVLSSADPDEINLHAELSTIVRDLEAAPAPERRTITREEHDEALAMCQRLRDRNAMPRPVVERLLDILRLTVED